MEIPVPPPALDRARVVMRQLAATLAYRAAKVREPPRHADEVTRSVARQPANPHGTRRPLY